MMVLSNTSETPNDHLENPELQSPPMEKLTFELIDIIFRLILTDFLALGGLVTNVVNVIVFYRQGILSDSNNLALTGLAISDFFCCLFTLYSNVLLTIRKCFRTEHFNWDVWNFYIFSGIRPKTIFIQITCWLTSFIALERFTSVVFPFQVKTIFTPKRALFVVCFLFIAIFALYYPQYVSHRPAWVEYPQYNVTILKYVETNYVSPDMGTIFLYMCPISLRIISTAVVLLCNITILWKVKLSRKFRKASSVTTNAKATGSQSKIGTSVAISSASKTSVTGSTEAKNTKSDPQDKNVREKRLLRMVTLICVIFLICFTPDIFLVMIFYVLSFDVHWYVFETCYIFSNVLETINSSTNLIVYYKMSTRYRKELQLCFGKRKK